MAKPEWGVKRLCPACNTKFYDLLRSPIECPSCGATIDLTAQYKPRKGKGASKRAEPAAAIVPEDADDLVVTDDEDNSPVEDDDVLDLEDDDTVDADISEAAGTGSSHDDEESFSDDIITPDADTESLDALSEENDDDDDDDDDDE